MEYIRVALLLWKILMERPLLLVLKGKPSNFSKMESVIPPGFQKKKSCHFYNPVLRK